MMRKLTFFKSYQKLGWWAARVPAAADWAGCEVDLVGFGVTQTQAEKELVAKEQARRFEESAELAA